MYCNICKKEINNPRDIVDIIGEVKIAGYS
jgi:hypothetical protein